MHRVISAHVQEFQKAHELSLDPSKAFEAMTAFAMLRKYSADTVGVLDLVYTGDDPGIDAVLIFLDDTYIASAEEAREIFARSKREIIVQIVIIQSKSGENWVKKEINSFESAIIDFFREHSNYPIDSYLIDRRETFAVILSHIGRIKSGKPNLSCYYITGGREPEDREIVAAIDSLRLSVRNLGLFTDPEILGLGREAFLDLWRKAMGPVEATLPAIDIAAFPKTTGVEEGYVATVSARLFVEKVLSDQNGKLRHNIFEENVRDFYRIENPVNAEILKTLEDNEKQARFGIMNNGITLLSSDVRIQSKEIFIRNYQIVNGCQTSNVLFYARGILTENATVMVKIIETSDPSLIDDVVKSTNRQTKVHDQQFLATLDTVKAIERFFQARDINDRYRLFFERRRGQYDGQGIAACRVVDIKQIARATGAMFFDRPDLASQQPTRLLTDLRTEILSKRNIEDIYYTAAYVVYKLDLLFGNKVIDSKYQKFKWHVLMAIKYYVANGAPPTSTHKKSRDFCSEIEKFMAASDNDLRKELKNLCERAFDTPSVTRHKLGTAQLVTDVKRSTMDYLRRRGAAVAGHRKGRTTSD